MIAALPRVIASPPDRPERPERDEEQRRALDLATRPAAWNRSVAADVIDEYTRLAPIWNAERGGYRTVPLADALARGAPFPVGPCVDVGSGTGLLVPRLRQVWPDLVAVDLSPAAAANSNQRLHLYLPSTSVMCNLKLRKDGSHDGPGIRIDRAGTAHRRKA